MEVKYQEKYHCGTFLKPQFSVGFAVVLKYFDQMTFNLWPFDSVDAFKEALFQLFQIQAAVWTSRCLMTKS